MEEILSVMLSILVIVVRNTIKLIRVGFYIIIIVSIPIMLILWGFEISSALLYLLGALFVILLLTAIAAVFIRNLRFGIKNKTEFLYFAGWAILAFIIFYFFSSFLRDNSERTIVFLRDYSKYLTANDPINPSTNNFYIVMWSVGVAYFLMLGIEIFGMIKKATAETERKQTSTLSGESTGNSKSIQEQSHFSEAKKDLGTVSKATIRGEEIPQRRPKPLYRTPTEAELQEQDRYREAAESAERERLEREACEREDTNQEKPAQE